MSDERRKRARQLMESRMGLADVFEDHVDAMLAFADEEVAKERSRCAKIARECIHADLVECIVEKIERGKT